MGGFFIGILFGFVVAGAVFEDGDHLPASPAQFQQAMADCAAIGERLRVVRVGTRVFSSNRVYAECIGGAVITRIIK